MNFFIATIIPPHRIVSLSFAPPLLINASYTTCLTNLGRRTQCIHKALAITVHGAKARLHLQESRRSRGLSRIAPSTTSPFSCRSTSALGYKQRSEERHGPSSRLSSPHLPASRFPYANDYGSSTTTIPVNPSASDPSTSHPQRYNVYAPRRDAGNEGEDKDEELR